MKFAVIDCETSGLSDYAKPADDPCQPRLAALAVVMLERVPKMDEVGKDCGDLWLTLNEHEWLVKPEGWEMTPGATAANGLTTERLLAEGIEASDVLSKYRTLVQSGFVVASYGAQYDCKVMRGEFRRRGLDDLFEETRNVCLMRACQGLGIVKASGKGGWPKLSDACAHFGIPVEPSPHRALNGARCAAGVLLALAKLGKLPDATIHRAANAPTRKALA